MIIEHPSENGSKHNHNGIQAIPEEFPQARDRTLQGLGIQKLGLLCSINL